MHINTVYCVPLNYPLKKFSDNIYYYIFSKIHIKFVTYSITHSYTHTVILDERQIKGLKFFDNRVIDNQFEV